MTFSLDGWNIGHADDIDWGPWGSGDNARAKILTQKRAILDELESPRGNLPLVARLMASPAAMPIPRPIFPQTFLNANVGRSRSQSRAVAGCAEPACFVSRS